MRIEEDLKLDYSDVLFRPKRSTLSSRKDVNLKRTYKFKYSNNEWSGIPIMAANMDGVGELGIAEKLSNYGMITCLTKQHDIKKIKQFKKIKSIYPNIALSIGIKKEDFQNLDKVLKEYSFIKFLCIDVANGYSERFSAFLKSVRDKYPTKTIIAGNVVTADMTQELILSGADIVKVGIGPGSVCTTRIQTGVGYPQLSAVIECADAAHGLGAHMIADGGCTCPGDVAKGFGGGADFVMLGGLWEFPGGKVEGKESLTNALKRELKEECGVSTTIKKKIGCIQHSYSHFSISLHLFHCKENKSKIKNTLNMKWIKPKEIDSLPFPKANHKLFTLLDEMGWNV